MSGEGMGSGDPRVDALMHLQQAALEFIAAARAVLDLAEDAVREPGSVVAVVSETIGAFAGLAGARRRPAAAAEPGDEPSATWPPARTVQHIRIS